MNEREMKAREIVSDATIVQDYRNFHRKNSVTERSRGIVSNFLRMREAIAVLNG